jgi:hypothetical protein
LLTLRAIARCFPVQQICTILAPNSYSTGSKCAASPYV